MNVVGLPNDLDGNGYYRFLNPAKVLTGVNARTPEPRWVDAGGKRMPVFDLALSPPRPAADVYVFCKPVEKIHVEFSRPMTMLARALVVDLDDDVLSPPTSNPAYWSTSPKNPEARRNGVSRDVTRVLCEAADLVTVATEALRDKYSMFNPKTVVLPNYLDWDWWQDITPAYQQERERVRVGWYGTLAWRRDDLKILRGVLGPWLERNPHVDFVVSGPNADATHDYLGVPHAQRVSNDGWCPTPDLPSIVNTCDIGLVPLAPGTFNDCKSHLKGLEFNAAGVPVIASPSQPYQEWVDGNGILARKPREWTEALDALTQDTQLRHRMGEDGRRKASENTIQQHAWKWERAWASAFTSVTAQAAIGYGALQDQQELENLLARAWELQPNVIVEIGSGAGGTLIAWRRLFPNAVIVTVDLPGGKYGGHLDLKIPPGVHHIPADSHHPETLQKLRAHLDGKKIDLLFIDGDHTHHGVEQDDRMYRPLVRQGGLVVFHDIVYHDPALHPIYSEVNVKDHWDSLEGRKTEVVGNGAWGGIGILQT